MLHRVALVVLCMLPMWRGRLDLAVARRLLYPRNGLPIILAHLASQLFKMLSAVLWRMFSCVYYRVASDQLSWMRRGGGRDVCVCLLHRTHSKPLHFQYLHTIRFSSQVLQFMCHYVGWRSSGDSPLEHWCGATQCALSRSTPMLHQCP